MSTKILDCTLRDGGYINNWKFGRKTILSILDKLDRAGIEIIECGFLTQMVNDPESSLFSSAEEIKNLLPKRKRNSMYVAMIAIGEKELLPETLSACSKDGISGIRLTFHKNEIEKAIQWASIIMEKGYEVFMQPVGTVFYTDMELLALVEKMNELRPYAFYIVDTLGSMYRNEVSHRFYIIDENMHPDIHLGFHGHNNLQLAFSNAQVLGKIQSKRTLILDSSVYGMGRGAGNLPTELIAQYINRKVASRYDVSMIMDIYDEYIAAIRKEYEWGYTLPYHIAASNVCHPNYASYLINKQTLTMKGIEKIIQAIPKEAKVLYDQALIERLYLDFQNQKIDDSTTVKTISSTIKGKKVLILAPGNSLALEQKKIKTFIETEHPYIISIHFIETILFPDACFVSNQKRMDLLERELCTHREVQVILTSNIRSEKFADAWIVDYDSYTIEDSWVSDNAGLMLLNLLKQCGTDEVYLAGFDGFYEKYQGNYYSNELNLEVKREKVHEKQKRIRGQMQKIKQEMRLIFLTASVYE